MALLRTLGGGASETQDESKNNEESESNLPEFNQNEIRNLFLTKHW